MKTRKNLKKLLSLVLVVLMLTSVFSITSFASDEVNESEVPLDLTKYGDSAYMLRGDTTSFLYGTGNCYDLEINQETYGAVLYYQLINMITFNNRNVNTIVLDETVTSVGALQFSSYTSVDYLYLPSALTYIGDYAFTSDYKTKNIDIPSSVEHIGEYAFASIMDSYLSLVAKYEPNSDVNTDPLERYNAAASVTVYSDDCVIEENAFSPETVIHGYAGSTAEAYALANGNEFATIDANATEPNWTWDFEEEFVCTQANRLIGTDENSDKEVILIIDPQIHYDTDGDGNCDICGDRIPSIFEVFINILKNYFNFIKELLSILSPF